LLESDHQTTPSKKTDDSLDQELIQVWEIMAGIGGERDWDEGIKEIIALRPDDEKAEINGIFKARGRDCVEIEEELVWSSTKIRFACLTATSRQENHNR
jgi:hypothetical protein